MRENAESVALSGSESRLRERLLKRIDELVQNFRRITSVNRNLGFFTTGYNYLDADHRARRGRATVYSREKSSSA